jgi:hypothetical protein
VTSEESLLCSLSWAELAYRRTEYRSPGLTVPLLFCFSVFIRWNGNVLTEPLFSNGLLRFVTGICVSEPLASNGLLWLSGVISQYVSINRKYEINLKKYVVGKLRILLFNEAAIMIKIQDKVGGIYSTHGEKRNGGTIIVIDVRGHTKCKYDAAKRTTINSSSQVSV